MRDKAAELDLLRPRVLACRACALRGSASQVVFGEGYPDAALVFIGEGPGAEEDRLGRPFVGPAGQLLDKMIEAMGMERSRHAYILNIVKCRPPGNRPPTNSERTTCISHLNRQLMILDPTIVILLGNTALQSLIDPALRITGARGHWIEHDGRWWMPTYHPAALLREPRLKSAVWKDLKLVLDKYRQLVDPSHVSVHYPRPPAENR